MFGYSPLQVFGKTSIPFIVFFTLKNVNVKHLYGEDLIDLEAAVGFEPTYKGFADLRLRPLGNAAIRYQKPNFFKKLGFSQEERETGLEPATSTLARLRSTN